MARKIDLSQLTFCIPVRIDSDYRLRNLLTMLSFYSRHIRANYIILEADAKQRIKDLPPVKGLCYKFISDTARIFHRTRYINQMLRNTTTPFAAIWDTDAIAPVSQLKQAYAALQKNESTMIYPYDGRFCQVDYFHSALFCRNKQIKILTSDYMPRAFIAGYYSVGGAFLVNVQAYKSYGWENEHFIGWGPEDVERYHRMEILGERPSRINGMLYHLFHTRGVNSGDFDPNLAVSTKREYIHVCSMMPDELRAYMNTWEWIK